jgi:hypothetical protein
VKLWKISQGVRNRISSPILSNDAFYPNRGVSTVMRNKVRKPTLPGSPFDSLYRIFSTLIDFGMKSS